MPPWPLLEVAIAPRFSGDRDRLVAALGRLAAADASIAIVTDHESGQTMVGGASEHHLDDLVTQLRTEVELLLGPPQVVYRETVRRRVEQDFTQKVRRDGVGEFARVKLVVEPAIEPHNVFSTLLPEGSIPEAYANAIERGVAKAMCAGILVGGPLMDVRVTLVDGAYHDADSSVEAFEDAAKRAVREALQIARPVLLEPVMIVEVTTPERYLGAVIGDLKSRRGTIMPPPSARRDMPVGARVPLVNLFGYSEQLRSLSQGSASFTMGFVSYEPVPPPEDGGRPPPAIAAALRA